MEQQDINNLIREAKDLLKIASQNLKSRKAINPARQIGANLSPEIKTALDYKVTAERIFGRHQETGAVILPSEPITVISEIRKSKKLSTLRKQATSIRLYSAALLKKKVDLADVARDSGSWVEAEKIVSHPSFFCLMQLVKMMPADYRRGWTPESTRKSKKTSLQKLQNDWREVLAKALPEGHFTIPALAQLLTGARPAEMERGIKFIRIGDRLRVRIRGVKVNESAGQPWRCFDVANHYIKHVLLEYMDCQRNPNILLARVKNGNSLTTHLRAVGRKLWPNRKEAITCYSARHAMAADCKVAIKNGADPDLASMVLGHRVDKTASYYGSIFQGGGISIAPTNVKVSLPVKNKLKVKNSMRKAPGQLKGKGIQMST